MPIERRTPASIAYEKRYAAQPKQKKRRAQRNAARRKLMKLGKVRKGDGKDVDHKNFNTADNSLSNLHVMSEKANRAKNRGTGGRKKKRR